MRGLDRQTGAFVLALAAVTAGTFALGADGGLPSYLGGAALCAAALLSGGRAPLPLPFWLGAGTIGWLLVHTGLVGNWWIAGPELAAMAGIAGAFVVGVRAGSRTETARRAALTMTVILTLLAILAFVSHIASPDAVLGRPKPYHAGRLTGSFLSANTAATLSAMAMVLGLGGVARSVRGADGLFRAVEAVGRHGLASGLLVLFAAACLLLTGSRGGLLAAAVGAGVVLWPTKGAGHVRWPTMIGFGAVGAVLLVASGGVIGDRLADVGTGSSGRTVLWRVSSAAWLEAPLLGHGLGSFSRAIAPLVTAETAPQLGVQGAAHNVALQWLVQTGIVGTLLGAATVASLVRMLGNGLSRRKRGRWILRAALGGMTVLALHGLVDYALEVPAVSWWLALLCGLGCGVADGGRQARERRKVGR